MLLLIIEWKILRLPVNLTIHFIDSAEFNHYSIWYVSTFIVRNHDFIINITLFPRTHLLIGLSSPYKEHISYIISDFTSTAVLETLENFYHTYKCEYRNWWKFMLFNRDFNYPIIIEFKKFRLTSTFWSVYHFWKFLSGLFKSFSFFTPKIFDKTSWFVVEF